MSETPRQKAAEACVDALRALQSARNDLGLFRIFTELKGPEKAARGRALLAALHEAGSVADAALKAYDHAAVSDASDDIQGALLAACREALRSLEYHRADVDVRAMVYAAIRKAERPTE